MGDTDARQNLCFQEIDDLAKYDAYVHFFFKIT